MSVKDQMTYGMQFEAALIDVVTTALNNPSAVQIDKVCSLIDPQHRYDAAKIGLQLGLSPTASVALLVVFENLMAQRVVGPTPSPDVKVALEVFAVMSKVVQRTAEGVGVWLTRKFGDAMVAAMSR